MPRIELGYIAATLILIGALSISTVAASRTLQGEVTIAGQSDGVTFGTLGVATSSGYSASGVAFVSASGLDADAESRLEGSSSLTDSSVTGFGRGTALSGGNTSATALGSFQGTSFGPGKSASTSAGATASTSLSGAADAFAEGSAAVGNLLATARTGICRLSY
ncbi:hypothetical protein ACKKBF_B19465 [Auxenochlorella protothecoides x Auxenochlorella symbiontica]